MDQAAKEVWVAALRSRKYRQGRGQLCDKNGRMCCLGVLIDVTQDGEWNLDGEIFGYSYDGNPGLPSDSVRRNVGLTDVQAHQLADLNDQEKWNFSKIADHIEANL